MKADNLLRQLGFTATEAKLYLASLELGPASAIQLGRKLGVTRQLVYGLLPNLEDRGLIKQVKINKKQLYQAVSPDVLTDIVEGLAQKTRDIVPMLKTKEAQAKSVPLVTVFENPLSIRDWYRMLMKELMEGDELRIWATNTAWHQMDPVFYDKYIQYKIKNKVRDRIIAPDTEISRSFERKIDSPYAEYRYLTQAWSSPTEKVVWRNQVAHFTIANNVTNMILLESDELADLERAAFDSVWSSLTDTTKGDGNRPNIAR